MELVMQLLLKQKRRQPSHEERVAVYRRQDGKCEHCSGELSIENEEFDHVLPCRDAVAGREVVWRCLCKACHALLTDREASRKNPLLSAFNTYTYHFVDSPKPVPATFKANAIDSRVPLMCLDIKRCRASILRYSPWEWVAACAADALKQAPPRQCD